MYSKTNIEYWIINMKNVNKIKQLVMDDIIKTLTVYMVRNI